MAMSILVREGGKIEEILTIWVLICQIIIYQDLIRNLIKKIKT